MMIHFGNAVFAVTMMTFAGFFAGLAIGAEIVKGRIEKRGKS